MHKVCILTDSSVQFTHPGYLGNELVFITPFSTQPQIKYAVNNAAYSTDNQYGIEPPPVKGIINLINKLHQDHNEIMVITLSSALSELFSVVENTIGKFDNPDRIKIIDSQTTSIGLGILVQLAAGLAAQGATINVIEYQLRISIKNIYTLLCLPNLSYLAAANFLLHPQAVIGEMLGVLPIYSLEDGRLTSIQKVRTQKHLLETFQEFLDEFITPSYVAIIKKFDQTKTFNIRDYVKINFPLTIFSEHLISDSLVNLLGPQSVGLIIIDNKLGVISNSFSEFIHKTTKVQIENRIGY